MGLTLLLIDVKYKAVKFRLIKYFYFSYRFNMLCRSWNYAQYVRKESLEQQEKLVLIVKVMNTLESSVRELVCDYCGQKRSNAGVNEYI